MMRPLRTSERGAVLVELCFVLPLVTFVLFAILDFGVVFRDQLTVQDAVSDAARAGSIVGPDTTQEGGNADYEIISALREGLGSVDSTAIRRIVVFRGSATATGTPESQVPAACRSGTSVAGVCNVYPAADAFLAAQTGDVAYFRCSSTPTSPACNWQPEGRDDGPSPTTIQYVGVYVELASNRVVGAFGPSTVSRAAIARLEPGEVDL
jgi:hypothetical protein